MTAERVRAERVNTLVQWASDYLGISHPFLYDNVLSQAKLLYPTLHVKTLESYAKSATKILRESRLRRT